MSVTVDDLGLGDDGKRLDRWGRYLIVPPGDAFADPVGYTRVTTVAKALDEGGGLAPWKAAMCAYGILQRPGLRAKWEALLAECDGDPWYHSVQGKARCKSLVEQFCEVGGALDRRDVGSAWHSISALIDVGREPDHLTDETARAMRVYRDGLTDRGIEILDGMIEVTVVLDRWLVAGTVDRIVTTPGRSVPMVADLKTGADLKYSWQSIAVQLAAYAHADEIYVQGESAGEDQRKPMPRVDREHGLVFHLHDDVLDVWMVDLVKGWEAFERSMWVRGWRNTPVARPVPSQEAQESLVPILEASLAQAEAKKGARGVKGSGGSERGVQADTRLSGDQARAIRRDWLQARIDVIGGHDRAKVDLAREWPQGMATLKRSTAHTSEDLDVVETLLDDIEKRWELAFLARPSGGGDASIVAFPGNAATDNDKETDNSE